MVKKNHNKISTTSTTLVTNESNSSAMVQYTDREQSMLKYIEEQGRRLEKLENQQELTMKEMKEAQKAQNQKIERTISAKLQPHNEKLESISDSINNIKRKSDTNQTTMDRLDSRFDMLDNRLDKMLKMYEIMAQFQTSNMGPYGHGRLENDHRYPMQVTQTQSQETAKLERYSNRETTESSTQNQRKEQLGSSNIQQQTSDERTIWDVTSSPQPKQTPNKKYENIQEKKAGSTTTTITNRSPTTDEKGVERGGKRLKTPTPQNDKNTALTAKVKQEMIDEAIVTELDGLGLKTGNTKATSISLINDGDGEGEWTTMGKNNTPVAKEKMRNNRKSTIRSPVATRSTITRDRTSKDFTNGKGAPISVSPSRRTKSPRIQRRTVATQNPTNAKKYSATANAAKRGQVGLRGPT